MTDILIQGGSRGGKFKLVSGASLSVVDDACGQLNDGMSGETCGEAPGAYAAPDFFHFLIPVDVHEIEGELHEKCVDGFTRDDPEALARIEARSTEEAFVAGGGLIRDLHMGCESCIASKV